MARAPENVQATLDELTAAGYVGATWERGKHIKIRVAGLPPITVSGSPSDRHAANQARRAVRKIIAQNKLTR